MKEVIIDYTNWRGERALRRIRPIAMQWTSNRWHANQQWLLQALDVQRGEVRYFAMTNIHEWRHP